MNKLLFILSLLAFCGINFETRAQAVCAADEVEVTIVITPDQYPNETSWKLTSNTGELYAEGHTDDGSFCVPNNVCIVFTIYDSYGDGILGNGGYQVLLNDVEMGSGSDFGSIDVVYMNCPTGSNCQSPEIALADNNYTAPNAEHWYRFDCTLNGMYKLSTCGLSNCDTKLWIYDKCQGISITPTVEGSTYFNDNANDCAPQSEITAIMEAGESYWIRVGTNENDCTGAITWSFSYDGPIMGCTDPNACNFNPLAEVSTNDCIYPGSPECSGPDLVILKEPLVNSLYLSTINADNCDINEGCTTGYGQRYVINFNTDIANIGDLDYFIGDPNNNPNQFDFVNCHQHAHYKGYAEYILFDENNQETPVGFKSGFCVMDLICPNGGGKFGCGQMGISAGCIDSYAAGTRCNWIDITDVMPGNYTLVVRTNWDQSPDALGRHEIDYTNNWTQICIKIERVGPNPNPLLNPPTFALLPDCPEYVDCAGQPFGSAQIDCTGACGGTVRMGDMDNDGVQSAADAQNYVYQIITENTTVSACTDLDANGTITVNDAALLLGCSYGYNHQNEVGAPCNLPYNVVNINDTVFFRMGDVNFYDNYVDVYMKNPYNRVVAYQLKFVGMGISNALSLVDANEYPDTPYLIGNDEILSVSFLDSTIDKHADYIPLCRLYYNETLQPYTCIGQVIDVVNDRYEKTIAVIENGGCSSLPALATQNINASSPKVAILPNPVQRETTFYFENPHNNLHDLSIFDTSGKMVFATFGIQGSQYKWQNPNLPKGIYLYVLKNNSTQLRGKLAIQ